MNKKQIITLLIHIKKQIPKTCRSFAYIKTISGSDRLYLRIIQPNNPYVTDIEIKTPEQLIEISTTTINNNRLQNQQYWYHPLTDPNTIQNIKTKLKELYSPTNITT